jgi:hypothetical protein
MTQVLLIDSGASKNCAIRRALRSAASIHRYGKKQRSNWNFTETVNWTDEHHNKSRETVLADEEEDLLFGHYREIASTSLN